MDFKRWRLRHRIDAVGEEGAGAECGSWVALLLGDIDHPLPERGGDIAVLLLEPLDETEHGPLGFERMN